MKWPFVINQQRQFQSFRGEDNNGHPLLELSTIDFHGQLNGWIRGRLCFTFNPIE